MKKQDPNQLQIQPSSSSILDLKQQLLQKQLKKSHGTHNQQHNSSQNLTQKKGKIKQKYQSQNNILQGKNFISSTFFSWISTFAEFGDNFQITTNNVPILPQNQKPKIQFDKMYNILKKQKKNQRQGVALTKTIAKTYSKEFIILFILSLFFVGLSMYTPVLTDQIINFIQQGSESRELSKGIPLFIGVLCLTLFRLLFQSHVFYKFGIIGFNLSNTLSLLLYQKSLKHPVLCLKKYSVSEIINYSQVDAQRMTYMGFQLSSILFAPLQVVIGLWLMYNFIGISFLSGIGVMIITIILTFICSKISIKANQSVLKAKDERMKVTQQIFSIIRFIKINAFQKYFWQKLNSKRQVQLNQNKRRLTYQIITIFIYWLASPLILSMTFATYTWLGNQMSAAQAFTTIMLFSILKYPIRLLPTAISSVIQMWTSIKRLQKFLLSEQIEYENIRIGNNKDLFAIKITNGTFGWGKQKDKQKQKEKQKEKQKKETSEKNQNKELKIQEQQVQQKESILEQEKTQVEQMDPNEFLINQTIFTESVLTHQSLKNNNSKRQRQKCINENKIEPNQKQNKKQKCSQQENAKMTDKKKEQQINKKSQKIVFVKTLKDIDIEIQTGTFNMIVGDIGSGKSSLIFAILNQMKPNKNALIEVNGSIAYVPQKPWIMSSSLRDNVTFTLPFHQQKFNQAIKYASMETDLALLPDGQMTQIGEKGTNLSGGQKARIGLARALYSERDIYLLDDIISAVDVHVGQFLMKETILKFLRNKTVIMPTHAIKFAQYADKIIIMKKGKVIKVGSYQYVKNTEQFQQIALHQNIKKTKKKQLKSSNQDQKVIQDLKKIKTVKQQKKQKSKQLQEVQNKNNDLTQKIVEQLILPEDHRRGNIGLNIYKQYVNLNGGLRFLIVVALCMVGWLSFTTSSNIWMEKWCEAPQKGNQYLYIFLGLSITSSVFMVTRAYTLVIGGVQCGRIVHKKIIKSLLYASLNKFYNRVPLGRIINRLSKDLREIDQAIGYSVGNFFVSSFSLFGTLIICLYASTYLVVIPMILVAYISNRFRIYYMKTQRQCVRLENITSSPIVSGFLSAINGIQTIRAYNLQENFLEMQIKKIDQNKRLRITREALQSWFCQRLSFITFFINMSAIAYCMFSTNENPSLAGLLLTYALTLADDIIDTIFSFTYLQTRMVSVQRVSNFMKIQPQQGYKEYTQNWRTKQQGYNQVIKQGKIEFIDTKVKYREELPYVLKGISLEIKKGEKVGIVGRTGAGKSTIINCLLRILDCADGQIRVDGKNIKDYFLKDLRYNITMIDQEPTLINGTFKENLDPRNTYTVQELNNIVKQCNLAEVVKQKGGLQSRITNDSLSVGQKQLLCICRAFLKHSKIVLVDQATANIDQKNDQLIQQVISTKFKESTVLTIAHRLSTLKNSDKILVLGQGQVLEWGSPDELLQKQSGIYKAMCQKGNITEEWLI